MSRLNFTLEREASGLARPGGPLSDAAWLPWQTPIFMPVGTQATVKGQTIHYTLKASGSQNVLLANTYHLVAATRSRAVQKSRRHPQVHELGPAGPHRLRGFQIFSLPGSRK